MAKNARAKLYTLILRGSFAYEGGKYDLVYHNLSLRLPHKRQVLLQSSSESTELSLVTSQQRVQETGLGTPHLFDQEWSKIGSKSSIYGNFSHVWSHRKSKKVSFCVIFPYFYNYFVDFKALNKL